MVYVVVTDPQEILLTNREDGTNEDTRVEKLDEEKRQALVYATLRRLPRNERTFLLLYFLEGLSMEDVGEALGISKSWASRRGTQALERFKKLFKLAPVEEPMDSSDRLEEFRHAEVALERLLED